MMRGIYSSWKQPLCYVLTCGPCSNEVMQSLLYEVVHTPVCIGLTPKVLIADQGTNNQALYSRLEIHATNPYFFENNGDKAIFTSSSNLIQNCSSEWQGNCYLCMSSCPPFSHLSVSIAAQVLSHSVASGIGTMVSLCKLKLEIKIAMQLLLIY